MRFLVKTYELSSCTIVSEYKYISPIVTELLLVKERTRPSDNCSVLYIVCDSDKLQYSRRKMYSQCKILSSHSQSHTQREVGH